MARTNTMAAIAKTLLGSALCLVAGPSLAADTAGKIVLMKGEVFILDAKANVVGDPQGKRGRKTQVGTEFFVGETLSTKPGARVKLQFLEGGNEVVLGADTTMLIERAGNGSDKKGTTLNLSKGEVRSDVRTKYSGQGAEVYEVKSKNAVAGVRGTIFTAIFNPQSAKFTVATERGAVAVSSLAKGAGPAQLVTAGKFSTAVGDRPVLAPAPIASNPELANDVNALGGGSSGEKGSGDAPASEKSDPKEDSAKADDAKGGESGGSQNASGDKPAAGDKQEAKTEPKAEAKTETKSADSGPKSGDGSTGGAATTASGDAKPAAAEAKSTPSAAKTADAAPVKSDSPPLGRETVAAPAPAAASGTGRAPAAIAAPVVTATPILGDAAKNTPRTVASVPGLPANLGQIVDSAKQAAQKETINNTGSGTVRVRIK